MLTGRMRHRTAWFGTLILQVEYRAVSSHRADLGEDGREYIDWRDAKITDMIGLKLDVK